MTDSVGYDIHYDTPLRATARPEMIGIGKYASFAGSCVVGMFAVTAALKNLANRPLEMSEWYEAPVMTAAIFGGTYLGGLIGQTYPRVVITGLAFTFGWVVGPSLK